MDCCSHGYASTPRHWMWSTALAPVDAMLAGGVGPRGSTAAAQTAETASAALDVLRKSISVDVHTHGGKTGITSKAKSAAERRPRERHAGGIACGRMPRRRAGRPGPRQEYRGRSGRGALSRAKRAL